jgi:hypothetical protein
MNAVKNPLTSIAIATKEPGDSAAVVITVHACPMAIKKSLAKKCIKINSLVLNKLLV